MGYVRRTYNPYRSTKRTYAPYRTAYQKRKTTARRKSIKKARSVKTVAHRKRAIKRNTTAIRKLKDEMFGPLQRNISTTETDVTLHRDHPVLFLVSNPDSGYAKGPSLITTPATGSTMSALTHFNPYHGEGAANGDFLDDDHDHIANGPKLKLISVDLDFQFAGFVPNTRVRVDIIRQKRMNTAFWRDETSKNFLPYTLQSLRNICGHTPNEIPRKDFQILATKHVWLNSREEISFTDASTGEEETTAPTTARTKRCHIYLRLNKVFKQLDVSTAELNQMEENVTGGRGVGGTSGGYHFTNIHPLANIWCLISTDHTFNVAEVIDGQHAVKCSIVRKCTWRDAHD